VTAPEISAAHLGEFGGMSGIGQSFEENRVRMTGAKPAAKAA
jgi:hypothetical protein